MPSKKPTIIFIVKDDLYKHTEDYRLVNRIANRSEAVRKLSEPGLQKKA